MESIDRRPLYEQLAGCLRRDLCATIKPGERWPTESALARKYGVGLSSVREALSILAREGLVVRSHGRGTFAAEDKRVVGILCDVDLTEEREGSFRVHGPHYIHAQLHRAGHACRLYFGTADQQGQAGELTCKEFLDDLAGGRLSAVICVAERSDRKWLADAGKMSIPVIAFGRQGRRFPYTVDFGNSDVLSGVADYMVAEGRKRPAYIGWLRPNDDPLWSAENPPMYQQFSAALKAAGLGISDRRLRLLDSPQVEGAGWEVFRELWSDRDDRPDAIYVSDEGILRDVLMVVMELGIRVPDDLLIIARSIAGYQIVSPIPYIKVEHDLHETAAIISSVTMRLLAGDEEVPAVSKVPLTWQPVAINSSLEQWYRRFLPDRAAGPNTEGLATRSRLRSDNEF